MGVSKNVEYYRNYQYYRKIMGSEFYWLPFRFMYREIANKNNFPDDVLELIKANPIKFHKYHKFDNGRGIGRYYANLIRQMKR